jgi:mannosyltransferase
VIAGQKSLDRAPSRTAPGSQALIGEAPASQALHGQAFHGQAFHGQALHGQALHGQAFHGQALHGQALHGAGAPARPMTRTSRAAVYGVPALVAFSLGLWQISARSFSQDEGATLSASRRPLGALFRMLLHIDAVHGAYYLVIHFVILAFGASETAVRFPSVVATATAAAVLAALGTRLAGPRLGIAAGLLYAVSPPAAAYAQDARSFALATALAVIACYRFVCYAETGGRRNAVLYAVALAVTGWIDVVALLVLVTNAVTLLCRPTAKARRRGWAAAAAVAGLAVSPLIVLDLRQVSQVSWEKPPGAAVVAGLMALTLLGAVGYAALKPGHRRSGPAALAAVAVPWLLLPPVLLAVTSQITPLWESRYLLFCVPALALLAVAAAALLPARVGLAALTVTLTAALAAQPIVRPAVATDDMRAVSQLLSAEARPGDAVVFAALGPRLIKAAYPAGFAQLRDIGLDTSPAYRNTLYGKPVSQAVLRGRLAGVHRVWVIGYATSHPAGFFGAAAPPYPFCSAGTWRLPGSTVTLYLQCPAGRPHPR